MLLGLKIMFCSPLRALQGVAELAFSTLSVSNYTALCHHAQELKVRFDANAGQAPATLMTHQDLVDDDVLAELLVQNPGDKQMGVIRDDCAYDAKRCLAAIAVRRATVPLIGPCICRAQRHLRVRSPDTAVAIGRKAAATIGAYSQRTRCIRLKMLSGNRRWARQTECLRYLTP
ncbi:hypothetical protein WT49_29870 [Burkholderia territorii]|nr:hypothetical protein WT49_29870 [Burkholderia territorii]KWE43449.1 hypothetical protein WT51_22755 [Burkholderia territorii]KWE46618.1 hypothetical protein WT50_08835 [Burkholderia territorii]